MGNLAAKLKRQTSHAKCTAHQIPPPPCMLTLCFDLSGVAVGLFRNCIELIMTYFHFILTCFQFAFDLFRVFSNCFGFVLCRRICYPGVQKTLQQAEDYLRLPLSPHLGPFCRMVQKLEILGKAAGKWPVSRGHYRARSDSAWKLPQMYAAQNILIWAGNTFWAFSEINIESIHQPVKLAEHTPWHS